MLAYFINNFKNIKNIPKDHVVLRYKIIRKPVEELVEICTNKILQSVVSGGEAHFAKEDLTRIYKKFSEK